jgi:hypothetical protein
MAGPFRPVDLRLDFAYDGHRLHLRCEFRLVLPNSPSILDLGRIAIISLIPLRIPQNSAGYLPGFPTLESA